MQSATSLNDATKSYLLVPLMFMWNFWSHAHTDLEQMTSGHCLLTRTYMKPISTEYNCAATA